MLVGCAGSDRVVLPGHLHRGGLPQDPGAGVRPPPGQLPQEHVEHHGLRRRRHRVRKRGGGEGGGKTAHFFFVLCTYMVTLLLIIKEFS